MSRYMARFGGYERWRFGSWLQSQAGNLHRYAVDALNAASASSHRYMASTIDGPGSFAVHHAASVHRRWVRAKLRDLFSIDLRSLALFRIGLGVCVLADVVTRSADLVGLYTDRGALPRNVLLAMDGRGVYLSAHYWAGSQTWLQALLFWMTGAAAVALLVGWRTRLATLACWYLVSSVQVRQPLAYMAGDSILRLLLFWGAFLPLGARFSWDVSRESQPRPHTCHFSGATAALMIQVALIYWTTGLRKSGPLWWNGQAVSYALRADEWATPVGVWLRGMPWVLEPLNYATLIVELLGPFLAFVPLQMSSFRLATVALFWTFHLSLAAAMNIGLFPLFSMVAWLPFLPRRIWRGRSGSDERDEYTPAERQSRLGSILALVVLAYVLLLLAERTALVPRLIPDPVLTVGKALRIQQAWGMFAPDPPTTTARHELRVVFSDGVELTAPAATSFRWTIYLYHFSARPATESLMAQSLRHFGMYQCERWTRALAGQARSAVDRVVLSAYVRELEPARAVDTTARPLITQICPSRF